MLKQSTKVSEYELPVKINPQKEGGFTVTCSIWPDCYAQGETIDEAILEMTAVAQSLIEIYKEEDLKIPLKAQKERKIDNPFSVPIVVAA